MVSKEDRKKMQKDWRDWAFESLFVFNAFALMFLGVGIGSVISGLAVNGGIEKKFLFDTIMVGHLITAIITMLGWIIYLLAMDYLKEKKKAGTRWNEFS